LKPELSVAAIGGFNQIAEGIRAMKNYIYPGKIVIYPHVVNFPLTGLSEIGNRDQGLADLIKKDNCWTQEAEEYFLNKELSR
jgi:hypothetical protein